MARAKKINHEGGIHLMVSEPEHEAIQEWNNAWNQAHAFSLTMKWKKIEKHKKRHTVKNDTVVNAPPKKEKYRYTFDSEAHLYAFRIAVYMWSCDYKEIPRSREYEEVDWSSDIHG
jgi:hypothetical protein